MFKNWLTKNQTRQCFLPLLIAYIKSNFKILLTKYHLTKYDKIISVHFIDLDVAQCSSPKVDEVVKKSHVESKKVYASKLSQVVSATKPSECDKEGFATVPRKITSTKKYVVDESLENWDPKRANFDSVKNNYFFNEKSAEARMYGTG